MRLINNIKNYFNAKSKGDTILKSPKGICPNCWGKQQWEGEYYKFIKGENGNPNKETYNSFIQEVARKLDKIQISKNTYTCETCNIKYENI